MAKKRVEKDYDEYLVKVPKKDKAGNDITEDKLGGGGRHRKDGTISGMAYDFKKVDSSETAEKRRREQEFELEKLAHEEKIAKYESRKSKVDTAGEVLELINNGLTFLNDHPEIIEFVVEKGIKIKNFAAPRIAGFISGFKEGLNKNLKAEQVIEKYEEENGIVLSEEDFDIEDVLEPVDDNVEELSIEEARELVIGILVNYINMKKNLEKLSKARINKNTTEELELDDAIKYLEHLVKEYPQLMDITTTDSVNELLKKNHYLIEGSKVRAALKIGEL